MIKKNVKLLIIKYLQIFVIILANSVALYSQNDFLKIKAKNIYASYLYTSKISNSNSIDTFKIELSSLDSGKIFLIDFFNLKQQKNKIFIFNKLNHQVLDENFKEINSDSLNLAEKVLITFYLNPSEFTFEKYKNNVYFYKMAIIKFPFKNENFHGKIRINEGLILTLQANSKDTQIIITPIKFILDSRIRIKRIIKHYSR